jgi:uncharacterized RDD family membrane protein YckC
MFTIIGGDGREYGPATAEQLRGWINAGRANLDTKAKALGSEEWRRLGDFAEFASPSSPPALGGVPVATAPMTTPIPAVPAIPAIVDSNLAERGPRLLARAIDWAIEFAVAIPGGVILGSEFFKLGVAVMQGRQPDIEELDMQRLILGGAVLAIAWLLLLVVQVWMLSTRGQSIGKKLIGLRIVKVDGSSPGFVHAWLMREFLMSLAGGIISILPIVGPIMLRPALHVTDWCMIFRDDRRCLHDLIAGTKVVRA